MRKLLALRTFSSSALAPIPSTWKRSRTFATYLPTAAACVRVCVGVRACVRG
jgi:hypothetical protein